MNLQKQYYRKKEHILRNEKNPLEKENKLFNIWINYINEQSQKREKENLKYCSEKININN
jgi:hypothetical protein